MFCAMSLRRSGQPHCALFRQYSSTASSWASVKANWYGPLASLLVRFGFSLVWIVVHGTPQYFPAFRIVKTFFLTAVTAASNCSTLQLPEKVLKASIFGQLSHYTNFNGCFQYSISNLKRYFGSFRLSDTSTSAECPVTRICFYVQTVAFTSEWAKWQALHYFLYVSYAVVILQYFGLCCCCCVVLLSICPTVPICEPPSRKCCPS